MVEKLTITTTLFVFQDGMDLGDEDEDDEKVGSPPPPPPPFAWILSG